MAQMKAETGWCQNIVPGDELREISGACQRPRTIEKCRFIWNSWYPETGD